MTVPRASRCFSRALRPARRPALCAYGAEDAREVRRKSVVHVNERRPCGRLSRKSGTRGPYLVLLRPRPGHLCQERTGNLFNSCFAQLPTWSEKKRELGGDRTKPGIPRQPTERLVICGAGRLYTHSVPQTCPESRRATRQPAKTSRHCRWILERTRLRLSLLLPLRGRNKVDLFLSYCPSAASGLPVTGNTLVVGEIEFQLPSSRGDHERRHVAVLRLRFSQPTSVAAGI